MRYLVPIIIFLLPAFTFPLLLDNIPPSPVYDTVSALVWIYPFYMLLSAWLAWRSAPRRMLVYWLLLVMMILSTAAIYLLVFLPQS